MKPSQIIQSLGLEQHIEGGFYRRTYEASQTLTLNPNAEKRLAMTSIFYLLTADSPIGHWHRNRSDILHFFHSGSPLRYWVISPDQAIRCYVLGPDLLSGHQFQLLVPGGCWKASELETGDYGLISEAVTPGFVSEDMELAQSGDIEAALARYEGDPQRLKRLLSGRD